MAGTFVRDALAPDLFATTGSVSGSAPTLGSAATSSGPIFDLEFPMDFALELVAATAGGTGPKLDVEVLVSDSATFADTSALPTESLGRFSQVTAVGTYTFRVRSNKRYARVKVITSGTSPDWSDSTCTVVPYFDRYSFDQSA